MTRDDTQPKPYQQVQNQKDSGNLVPCHSVSFRVIACHCVSFRVIACHFVSFYIIPVPCHSCCKWCCCNAGIFTGLFADRRSIHVTCQQPEYQSSMCQYCNGLHSLYAAHHATHFLFGAHVAIAAYTSVAAFKAKRQILGLIIVVVLKTYRLEILEIVHS